MRVKERTAKAFQFVSIVPSATDDASKAERRRLVRSNAANYQWSRQKRRSRKPSAGDVQDLTPVSKDRSRRTADQQPADDVDNSDQVTGLNSESGALTLSAKDREMLMPLLVSYSNLILLPENGIGPLMKFNISYIVPNLVPQIGNGVENPAAPLWIQLAATSPALYYTWMHCAMIYYDALRGEPDECVEHKIASNSLAVNLINQQMLDRARACSDQNILAVLGLAVHGQDTLPPFQKTPTQGPLRNLQGLALYSSLRSVPLHLNGLALLIEMRGGLEKITLPGVGAIISYLGSLEATKSLRIPRWPFIPLGKTLVPLESMNKTLQAHHPLQNIGTGFPLEVDVWRAKPLSDLFSVIQAMCGYTILVYNHCEGRDFQESLCAVADQRNFIHHQLMSLPENPFVQAVFLDDGMYEATRLATIAFDFLVIFPASAVALPFVELSARLKRQLSYMDLSDNTTENLKYFIWITFMGGIASTGSDERPWFVSMLATLSARLDLSTWPAVQKLLQSFLWLPSTNNVDGMALWMEFSQLHSGNTNST